MHFDIYQNIGNLDLSKVIEKADSKSLPKRKTFKVARNGKEFSVLISYPKDTTDVFGTSSYYDAYQAINTIKTRVLRPDEIMHETQEGKIYYGETLFDEKSLTILSEEEVEKREKYIIAIANLLYNQETAETIVDMAQKKKDGSFYKRKHLLIASAGLAETYNIFDNVLIGIYCKTTDDFKVKVSLCRISCGVGSNDSWSQDFVSTYHPGLPVSEAIREMFE